METNQTTENLKETSETGLKGILKITGLGRSIFKFKVSLLALTTAFIMLAASFLFGLHQYDLIIEIKDLALNFLPGILGFTIAGYSLVVAFIPQSNMLHRITEKIEGQKHSHFQEMSSIFALNVIYQGFTLIIAYLFHFIIFFDNRASIFKYLPHWYIVLVNIIALFVIAYTFILSVLLVVQIVINIFNFSQTHHFFIVMDKIKNKNTPTQ